MSKINNDNDIIESVDRWEDKKYQMEMLRIENRHSRFKYIFENIFDIPGMLMLLTITIVSVAMIVGFMPRSVVDCSMADQVRLERMVSECKDDNYPDSCREDVIEVLCTKTFSK